MSFQWAGRTVILVLVLVSSIAVHAGASTLALRDEWNVQSACKTQSDGRSISTSAFRPQGWYTASVPSTVLAVQVASGEIPDPYVGTRLRDLPGSAYPLSREFFSNQPMPQNSPYRCGWWYREQFTPPAVDKGRTLTLHFGGINYRADIWINGQKVADKAQVAGTFRTYDFDVTRFVVPGATNVLAVETFAPSERDLGITWVDWNPTPPDKDMGLWGDVSLIATGPVALRSPLAVTHLSGPKADEADLSVYAELHNASDRIIKGKVSGSVAGVALAQSVQLSPGEERTIVFSPEQYPQLRLHTPRLWWPAQMGEPHLEGLDLRFIEAGGMVSDEQSVRFGIREITSELTDKGYRLFRINGKPILIRGAGWSQDMMLRENPARLRDEFRLVEDLRLNTLRLEGKMETEDFFRLADERGILVMMGWCCCDQWERWKSWAAENYAVAYASLRSQMLRVRSHPSLLVWVNGSDNPPPAEVERQYLGIEAETHWPNPVISSAAGRETAVSGRTGVKMTGPYDYVAPSYWYVDSEHGGAFGFNTETSPGPSIPILDSLKRFIPADQMWPVRSSAARAYHNGGADFSTLDVFNTAMNATFHAPSSLAEYLRISQAMSYDTERAMFEAYSRNKYTSTGVIQWMLNNAWPSMIWHLYDYYLEPEGSYFGAKKACEPLHVQYSYDDHSVVVVNSTYAAAGSLTASANVYDSNLKLLFSQKRAFDSGPDGAERVISMDGSVFQSASKIFFVDLQLQDSSEKVLSRNFYWVPARLTRFDWPKTRYTHTPALEYEDLSPLWTLPKARVIARATMVSQPERKTIQVRLQNLSAALAFQLVASVHSGGGQSIAPVLWSDNYIELLPGESRTITATLPRDGTQNPTVSLSGWNIDDATLVPTRP